VAPLAQELNALLSHNAAVVERARTHVGNLAHALKTPLSVLMNEAAVGNEAITETVRKQTELMRRQVDHYLVRARTAATGGVLGARSDVAQVVDDLHRTLAIIHRDRALDIRTTCPPALLFRGERQDLEEILGNLMDNACKWADSRVAVTAHVEAGRLVIDVDDDGPGLAPEQRSKVLERGTRLDESVPGSGLGLAIVRDIAGLYDGQLQLGQAPLGGLRATLVLPTVQVAQGR
jgi:signal transduction histidine kinase